MKAVQRFFLPGSEWIYLKIYVGYKTTDRLLTLEIASIIKKLQKKGIIEKWFFLRFSDPDTHIRLRILLKDRNQINEVFNVITPPLERAHHKKQIWKVQTDTYNRELERYGNHLIEDAESIFETDSECVLSILKILTALPDENYRWMIALRLIDQFLTDFGFALDEKLQFTLHCNSAFKQEFGFNEFNSKQLNLKYRQHKKVIEETMNKYEENQILSLLNKPIRIRTKKNKELVEHLRKETSNKRSVISLESLLSSYIHMSLIRLFRSNNRTHELVLYDYLRRYYASEIAKRKYSTVKE